LARSPTAVAFAADAVDERPTAVVAVALAVARLANAELLLPVALVYAPMALL
jgi:hypothetical protein